MVKVVAFRTEEKGRMVVVIALVEAVVDDALVAHTQEMAVDIVWLVEVNIHKKVEMAVDGRHA